MAEAATCLGCCLRLLFGRLQRQQALKRPPQWCTQAPPSWALSGPGKEQPWRVITAELTPSVISFPTRQIPFREDSLVLARQTRRTLPIGRSRKERSIGSRLSG